MGRVKRREWGELERDTNGCQMRDGDCDFRLGPIVAADVEEWRSRSGNGKAGPTDLQVCFRTCFAMWPSVYYFDWALIRPFPRGRSLHLSFPALSKDLAPSETTFGLE